MELDFDRKEIFLISVIILMIVAWTIGNLGGAYFGMEDERIERREREEPDYDEEGQITVVDIPTNIVRIFFGGLLIAGVVSIFISPNEDVLESLYRHIPKLLLIGFIYLLIELGPYIERTGARLEQILRPDIEFPTISDILPGESTHPISSASGHSIGILIFLVSTVVIIFFLIRHKNLSLQSSDTEEDISSTADSAITELHEGEDVRDVIIRNYQKMLIILEREGVQQEISFTPRELEKMAVERLSLRKKTIDEMTKLFEEAKYSDHLLGKEERTRALDNFKQIKNEIEGKENA